MAKSGTKPKEYTIHHYDRAITFLVSQGQHDNSLEIEIKIDDESETEVMIYLSQSEAEELAELLQKHYG